MDILRNKGYSTGINHYSLTENSLSIIDKIFNHDGSILHNTRNMNCAFSGVLQKNYYILLENLDILILMVVHLFLSSD